ncbi:LEA type 2 family protein [Candidatus Electronema sp. JC]|uniref:LEA type 2 family protein n=1 Tax=Candidatus Electronema sp. JC TaxID=3401570 RepID=UPI003B430126
MLTFTRLSRRAASALLLALSLLPLLSGCSSLLTKKKADLPSVALADMELQGIQGLETIFRLQLRVLNPDTEPLELRGLNCDLKVNGKSFAKGVSSEQITVPASGTATAPVLVYAGMLDMVGSVIELLQQSQTQPPAQPLRYELTGRLRIGPQGGETVPFWLKGSLPPEK